MQNKAAQNTELAKLLKDESFANLPRPGDLVKGTVISFAKNEIRIDVGGLYTGVVRGREIIDESREARELKIGDEIEATVLEQENENGELELSLRFAGHRKAWDHLENLRRSQANVSVRVLDANRGGLMVRLGSVSGFLPVSQLLPEHYPRVEGGDKVKILDKLKSFVGTDLTVRVIDIDERQEKLIVSEKQAHDELRAQELAKFKVGDVIEGKVTAITDFGVFVEFDKNFEGLAHISELSWQRVENPHDVVKIGEVVKASIINIDGSKIFLSLKRLSPNPWDEVRTRYKVGDIVEGEVVKINPFGLFVQLDSEIQGLAHISELGLTKEEKIGDHVKVGDRKKFKIISIEPEQHRLGLALER